MAGNNRHCTLHVALLASVHTKPNITNDLKSLTSQQPFYPCVLAVFYQTISDLQLVDFAQSACDNLLKTVLSLLINLVQNPTRMLSV